MKLVKEFKEFIMRGNVLDMAVGVIIATAFGKITTSLVSDIFMPFISWIFGARDMTALNVIVRPAELDAAGEVVKEAITIGFGTFVTAIIDFILVALVVFAIVKAFNSVRRKQAEEEPAPAEPEPTKEEQLLEEIRDLLKQNRQ
ncbi:MAG: large-conductance mechanosensitive channel protein MscL [Oscillospiraceae bacterium]|nr:large-conductance mechanosensitive channel protein MscL [Oscillospiraceae bacterium]